MATVALLADHITTSYRELDTGANPDCLLDSINGFNTVLSLINASGVRNQSVWTRTVDLSGVACWTSKFGTYWIPTAITPRHVITAYHIDGDNTLPVGTTIRWVGSDSVTVERTVTRSRRIGSTDFYISTLSSDLPSTVLPFRVMSLAYLGAHIPTSATYEFPAFFIKARNTNIPLYGGCVEASRVGLAPEGHCTLLPRNASDPLYLSGVGAGGDSGCAIFCAISNQPILLSTFTNPNSGPSAAYYHSAISAAVAEDGAYALALPSGSFPSF